MIQLLCALKLFERFSPDFSEISITRNSESIFYSTVYSMQEKNQLVNSKNYDLGMKISQRVLDRGFFFEEEE